MIIVFIHIATFGRSLDAIGQQVAKHLSEPLEHLALYNGADMNKYK